VRGVPGDGEIHFEPFLHLVDLSAEHALIAWGGFWFHRETEDGSWHIADDEELTEVSGEERTESIGARSKPFGPAVVEVERDGKVVARAEVTEQNHAWLGGLEPDTEYRYRVRVDGEPWADGELWDWDTDAADLVPSGRRYDNRFRTFPAPDAHTPVTFAVLGDFGIGIYEQGEDGERQSRLAAALERAVDAHEARLVLTTGDNIYHGDEGTIAGSGNEDDDWYPSFYAPYRYLLNRVPFFPTVGNHDTSDSERSDNRDQLDDNYFLEHRFRPWVETGRASLDPGLFYRFGLGGLVEFVCIDTSLADDLEGVEHYFDNDEHLEWVRRTLRGDGSEPARWRIPFSHHPPYCAGPKHGSTPGMVERLVPLFREAGLRLVLSGHEHNFQHSEVDGVHYVISGAGGNLRPEPPTDFEGAGTRAWSSEGHFLIVEADEERLLLHAVGDVEADGSLQPIGLRDPEGEAVETPIVVS
jgi:tartrate-resistant acid phosphatase type 5